MLHVWVHRMQANSICSLDPLVCNELGVLFYQERDYESAVAWLRRALDLLTADRISPSWQPTVVNLGHVYRKQGLFDDAVRTYLQVCTPACREPSSLDCGLAMRNNKWVSMGLNKYSTSISPESATTHSHDVWSAGGGLRVRVYVCT